jgi:hypothetical protein
VQQLTASDSANSTIGDVFGGHAADVLVKILLLVPVEERISDMEG